MPYLKTVTTDRRETGTESLPGDPEWDSARAPWNRAIDQRPLAVVHPRGVDDIRRLLDRAAADGTTVTTQPNGHGAAGTLENTTLIRPSSFREVRIDREARTARIGAGVSWGQLLHRLDGTGLLAPAGSNPSINVVGYLLAGGHSWFGRQLGQAARSVRAIEIVLPDGDHRRVGPEDADLFWALRGAGGALGVVTAIELDLTPAGELHGGSLLFPGECAEDVLLTVLAVGDRAPDHFSVQATLVRVPDLPEIPEPVRGRAMVQVSAVANGSDPAVDGCLAELRSAGPVLTDSVGAFRIRELGAVAAEPEGPAAARERAFLADLDAAAVGDLVRTFGSAVAAPVAGVQIRMLGGALARPRSGDGIASTVRARHLVQTVVPTVDRDPAPAPEALAAIGAAAGGTRRPGLIATFLSPGQTYADAYGDPAAERLQQVKDAVDPLGLVVGNRAVR